MTDLISAAVNRLVPPKPVFRIEVGWGHNLRPRLVDLPTMPSPPANAVEYLVWEARRLAPRVEQGGKIEMDRDHVAANVRSEMVAKFRSLIGTRSTAASDLYYWFERYVYAFARSSFSGTNTLAHIFAFGYGADGLLIETRYPQVIALLEQFKVKTMAADAAMRDCSPPITYRRRRRRRRR